MGVFFSFFFFEVLLVLVQNQILMFRYGCYQVLFQSLKPGCTDVHDLESMKT